MAQEPMAKTHLGSGIWSYSLFRRGAILMVTVPETIIRSDWRGEPREIMPKRSRSKREAKVAIISMAQQAKPKVRGHMEEVRAQEKSFSVEVKIISPPGNFSQRSAIFSNSSGRCRLFTATPDSFYCKRKSSLRTKLQ